MLQGFETKDLKSGRAVKLGEGDRNMWSEGEGGALGQFSDFSFGCLGGIVETFYWENVIRERSQLAGKLTSVSVNFLRLRPLGCLGRNFWKDIAFPELEIWDRNGNLWVSTWLVVEVMGGLNRPGSIRNRSRTDYLGIPHGRGGKRGQGRKG